MKTYKFDTDLTQTILTTRTLLMERIQEAPCFLLLEQSMYRYPIYIEKVEEGIELLLFPNEAAFTRSILQSNAKSPDLLFTESITINFLYHSIPSCQLPLIAYQNLIYTNKLGSLPKPLTQQEESHCQYCLNLLNNALLKLDYIPTLYEHSMVIINSLSDYHIAPFELHNKVQHMELKKEDHALLSQLPHTNEHLYFQFLILPQPARTQPLNIHLYAFSKKIVKQQKICVDSMSIFTNEIYHYFIDILINRGLPECIIVSSYNLYYLLQKICKTYDIILNCIHKNIATDHELFQNMNITKKHCLN